MANDKPQPITIRTRAVVVADALETEAAVFKAFADKVMGNDPDNAETAGQSRALGKAMSLLSVRLKAWAASQ